MNRHVKFIWQNFKVVAIFGLLSIICFSISVCLEYKGKSDFYENIFLSIGSGFFVASLFNVAYEYITKQSFNEMFSGLSKTLTTGIIVHPSHHVVISREKAIEKYLFAKGIVKIMTSTADNYVKDVEPPRYVLEDKIKNYGCSLQILLYLPVFEQLTDIKLGPRHLPPQQLINEQKALFKYYDDLISTHKGKVFIKFFTLTPHVNFIIIDNKRIFSAPVLHTVSGRDLPCFEIFPVGKDSLFYKFVADFDFLFNNKDKKTTLEFGKVKEMYDCANFDFKEIQKIFKERYINCT